MARRSQKGKPATPTQEPATETGTPGKKPAATKLPKTRKRGGGWDYTDDTDLRPGHTWDDFDRNGRGKPQSGYRGARLPWRS